MRPFGPTALILAVLAALALPAEAAGPLPERFSGEPSFSLAQEPSAWSADGMYEHIDGEAELVKRYGAVTLYYALYETPSGASLAVDLLDMGASVNAFGLFRLYGGCEWAERRVAGAVVVQGTFTTYARHGRWFLRIDARGPDGGDDPSAIPLFLEALGRSLGSPEPLPEMVGVLERAASRPCEVGYHPEDLDYDLAAGPGYRWVSPGREECFLRVFQSPEEAESFKLSMEGRGGPGVRVQGRLAAWSEAPEDQAGPHLEEVLAKALDVLGKAP